MSEEGDSGVQNKIKFKKPKSINIRKKVITNDDEDNDERTILEETKDRQRLRCRPNGVNINGLAVGRKLDPDEEIAIKDPFNLKSGGLMNMQSLKKRTLNENSSENLCEVGIGTQFSAETNKRDEDEEMMKYIEKQLKQRKGEKLDEDKKDTGGENKFLLPEEAALYALPDYLRQSSSNRSEEMLSNQMLNGIPEVDLGIDAKIKNIEATEEAKQKLLRDHKTIKDGPSQFVPTNMAVNFMQHNRFNITDMQEQKKQEKPEIQPSKSTNVKRATDDYHYDKFKKQFRRY